MPVDASEKPSLLIKKLGGLLLFAIGILLMAVGLGFGEGATWLTVLGILLVIGGGVALALKVIRRNQGGAP